MGKLFYRGCGIFCTDAVNFWRWGRKSRKKKGAGEAGYIYNRCISMARSQPFPLEKRDWKIFFTLTDWYIVAYGLRQEKDGKIIGKTFGDIKISRTFASLLKRNAPGRLAQLVQSVCLTSRGSAVRIRQRPPRILPPSFVSKSRTFSSAGSERLPYKQRVGGSNPSTSTKLLYPKECHNR